MIDFNSFKTTRAEFLLMTEIAQKARAAGVDRDHQSLFMDLEVAHHACPLDLQRLADAPDMLHDVCGIIAHLDRNSGELADCFVPRYRVRA